ncbi:MAG TPA: hypothetical protein VIV27_08615, partial [Halioglobus sp.]
ASRSQLCGSVRIIDLPQLISAGILSEVDYTLSSEWLRYEILAAVAIFFMIPIGPFNGQALYSHGSVFIIKSYSNISRRLQPERL